MFAKTKKEDLLQVAEELNVVVSSGAKVIELKNLIEQTEIFKTDKDFVQSLVQSVVDERMAKAQIESDERMAKAQRESDERMAKEKKETLELESKLELERIKLLQLEKQVELETVRSQSQRVISDSEYNQPVCNLENLIKSVKTLTLPVPTHPEAFLIFFQSLEKAFTTKNVPDELKTEILINILGEKANKVLTYVSENEISNYEQLKDLVLKEFQPTPQECLNNFNNAQRMNNESHVQFASRLFATFEYYCKLRRVSDFQSVCELIVSDKVYQTLDRETKSHVSVRMAEDWFRPQVLGRECDVFYSSRGKSLSATYTSSRDVKHESENKTYSNNQYRKPRNEHSFTNRNQKYQNDSPITHHPNKIRKCWICDSDAHFAKFCPKRFSNKNEGFLPDMDKNAEDRILNENLVSCFHTANSTDELEYKEIFVDGRKLKILIDSGASVSVINKNLFPRKHTRGNIILSTCFRQHVVAEIASFEFCMTPADRPVTFTAALSDKLAVDGILPPKFLCLLKAEPLSEKRYITHGGERKNNKQVRNLESDLRSSQNEENESAVLRKVLPSGENENDSNTEFAEKVPKLNVKEIGIKLATVIEETRLLRNNISKLENEFVEQMSNAKSGNEELSEKRKKQERFLKLQEKEQIYSMQSNPRSALEFNDGFSRDVTTVEIDGDKATLKSSLNETKMPVVSLQEETQRLSKRLQESQNKVKNLQETNVTLNSRIQELVKRNNEMSAKLTEESEIADSRKDLMHGVNTHLLEETNENFREIKNLTRQLTDEEELQILYDKEWVAKLQTTMAEHENKSSEEDKERENAMENAQEHFKSLKALEEENRKTHNRKRKKPRKYQIGDLVAIQTQFGTGLKLRPKFFGPYEVTKVNSNDRYDVKKVGNHEGPSTTRAAADFIKPWGFDEN